jgi:hypothetical protein
MTIHEAGTEVGSWLSRINPLVTTVSTGLKMENICSSN